MGGASSWSFREEDAAFATRKTFYVQLRDTFETIIPLVRFLNEPLVESLKTERRSHIFAADELALAD